MTVDCPDLTFGKLLLQLRGTGESVTAHCCLQDFSSIGKVIGRPTAECAMIYNDQKYQDCFAPFMALHKKRKRRPAKEVQPRASAEAAASGKDVAERLAGKGTTLCSAL